MSLLDTYHYKAIRIFPLSLSTTGKTLLKTLKTRMLMFLLYVCVSIYICVYRDGIVCRTQMGAWNFILMHLLTLSSNPKTAEQTEVGQGGNCPISAHYKVGVTSE